MGLSECRAGDDGKRTTKMYVLREGKKHGWKWKWKWKQMRLEIKVSLYKYKNWKNTYEKKKKK